MVQQDCVQLQTLLHLPEHRMQVFRRQEDDGQVLALAEVMGSVLEEVIPGSVSIGLLYMTA